MKVLCTCKYFSFSSVASGALTDVRALQRLHQRREGNSAAQREGPRLTDSGHHGEHSDSSQTGSEPNAPQQLHHPAPHDDSPAQVTDSMCSFINIIYKL